jgi:hypothetical protein
MVWPDILFYVRVILESDYRGGPAEPRGRCLLFDA